MKPPLITLKNLTTGFGHPELFINLELFVRKGDRIALVGRNGSGKSTLLKILAGICEFDIGERSLQSGVSIAYLSQTLDISNYQTAKDYLLKNMDGNAVREPHLVEQALSISSILPNNRMTDLSGGERQRLAVAGAITQNPDILLLDEPTNHLDINAIEWLEKIVLGFTGSIVVVSHDRQFLNNVSKSILWLDRGVIQRLDRNYRYFEEWAEMLIKQEADDTVKLDRFIDKETEWSREGISARRRRNQGRMRRLEALRHEQRERRVTVSMEKLETYTTKNSGKLVLEICNVSKGFNNLSVIKNFSARIMRGDRIGIIGSNGAGKSTLLKILNNQIAPDQGSIRRGSNIDLISFDQNREALNPEATLWETLCDAGGDQIEVHGSPRHIIGYLQQFLFDPSQARSPVKSLSGGEKNRLMLAKFLAKPSNLMILDEPTNDLDLETLDLLQEMLSEYNGTIVLVSHDRDFLDRIVTSTFVFEGDGHIGIYPGGFSDYLHQKKSSSQQPMEVKVKIKKKKPDNDIRKRTPGKLKYAEKRELVVIQEEIEKLEKEISGLNLQLNEEQENSRKLYELSNELGKKMRALEKKETRWLELELIKTNGS